jgi:hypothetical protein
MKGQRLLVLLTIVNVVLLTFSLFRTNATAATAVGDPPVLRGRALEIVDDAGRVRASITIFPADPKVRMPDGTVGYPETVLLRLISSEGRPNVKIAATERGSGMSLGGEDDPTTIQMLADGGSPSLKVVDKDGREQQLIKR